MSKPAPAKSELILSSNPVLIRGLEERCFNAWPTLRTVHLDGWVLRLADGHTRRANSASALYPSSTPHSELVDAVCGLYWKAGLTPAFRITPLADPSLTPFLQDRGFVEDDLSLVMAAELPSRIDQQSLPAGISVQIEAHASENWINGSMQAYGFGVGGMAALARMLPNLALPAAFLTLQHEGEAVGWALGVAERGFVGLYDIVVAPGWRGRGFGHLIVQALLDYGSSKGAFKAYLQVRAANERARKLYAGFGFAPVYAYSTWLAKS